VLVVGVGPVLCTTVVPVIVVVPPPGNTAVQLGLRVHVNGPFVPSQVVVWPEHVHVAGQVVNVVMLVTVTVVLVYEYGGLLTEVRQGGWIVT